MAEKTYDVIIIGSGPGGYVAAIRAAQLGFKVACIEKDETLGGTCLNVGCIPSKALLQASEKFHEARDGLAAFGVYVDKVSLDLKAMMGHKDKVVQDNVRGVEFLFKKNKVDWISGTASLAGDKKVKVGDKDVLSAKHIIIASGSASMTLPGVDVDEKRIVSSTGALALDKVPKHLAVIGGGYIGLELGSVWQRLGAKVTVIEFLDRIVPGMDGELAKNFLRILKKQGMDFKLSTKVTGAKATKKGVTLTLESSKGDGTSNKEAAEKEAGNKETLDADVVLVAIGRKPHTQGLGLEEAGVDLDERGRIKVGKNFETSAAGIYAIGDVIVGPMLAHKAEEEGVALVETLADQAGHVNYETVPGVVYTWPEVASVGKSEEELKADGVAYKVGKFPFSANGRARAANSTDGFVKILADKRTDRILGGHIIGPDAGTLIHEVVVAMEFGGSAEDLARSFHAHPTLNESVKEAALAVEGRPIHM